jgi:hypothetical protein
MPDWMKHAGIATTSEEEQGQLVFDGRLRRSVCGLVRGVLGRGFRAGRAGGGFEVGGSWLLSCLALSRLLESMIFEER